MRYVLLVEDNPCNRTIIEDIFEFDLSNGKLVCVESGEDALEQVAQVAPSLILMDIELPGIDGLETTKRLKGCESTKDIPIWAVTAHAMKGDEQKALAAGCEEYITKPIDTKELACRLSEFLQAAREEEVDACIEC